MKSNVNMLLNGDDIKKILLEKNVILNGQMKLKQEMELRAKNNDEERE